MASSRAGGGRRGAARRPFRPWFFAPLHGGALSQGRRFPLVVCAVPVASGVVVSAVVQSRASRDSRATVSDSWEAKAPWSLCQVTVWVARCVKRRCSSGWMTRSSVQRT